MDNKQIFRLFVEVLQVKQIRHTYLCDQQNSLRLFLRAGQITLPAQTIEIANVTSLAAEQTLLGTFFADPRHFSLETVLKNPLRVRFLMLEISPQRVDHILSEAYEHFQNIFIQPLVHHFARFEIPVSHANK